MNEKSPLFSSSNSIYDSFEEKKKVVYGKRAEFSRNKLFYFADVFDYCLVIIGTLASIIHGAGFPILSIVIGGMTTIFLKVQYSGFVGSNQVNNLLSGGTNIKSSITREEFDAAIAQMCLYYFLLGILNFFSSYIQIACWESFAERTTQKLRTNYLKSILRQEISWFDEQQTGNLTARLTDDLERVREGLGDKISLLIQNIATFIVGLIVGFIYSWKMTLVIMAFTPFTALAAGWMGRITATRTHLEQEKYAVAGAIAEEVFSSIRTVLSLNGAPQEIKRYENALEENRKIGLVKYMYMAIGMGSMQITMHISYAVAFWFGSTVIISDPTFDRGAIFTVFFAVMSGSMALGAALPHLATLSMAIGATKKIFTVLKSIPRIDAYSTNGIIMKTKGEISFENVWFSYPSRKTKQVLKNVSFTIKPGEKVAFVGSSGCGKSTILNLLLRFYDPDQGKITLDKIDISHLNIYHHRDMIGIVSQEPILFDGTLESNIRLGKVDVSHGEIIRACKQANAWEFIQLLPDGLKTRVGERGVQLSGGQKQRIAIARAIVKNPLILLLDEATSALDTESESVVQEALEQVQEGRTTIIIAHRLSTIRDVDNIMVLKDGSIVEQGSHEELFHMDSLYKKMALAQSVKKINASEVGSRSNFSDDESSSGFLRRKKSSASSKRCQSISSIVSKSSLMQISQLKKDIEESGVKPTPLKRILLVNRKTWPFLFFGLIGSCISGLIPPFFALVYSQIFSVLSLSADKIRGPAAFWSFMFIACGILGAIGFFISANMLGFCGEALTKKLRLMAFTNLLRQDIAFYDDPRHGTGSLCTRFATDVPNVRYVFTRLPAVLSSVVTLFGAIIVGFIFGWQLSLVLIFIVPLIIGSGYFQMMMQFGKLLRDTKLLEDAGKTATEAVEHIRTVQSLNRQHFFHEKYSNDLNLPYRMNMKQAQVYAGVFGFAQSIIFFMYAVAFWIGGSFVNNGIMPPINVYRVFFAFAFCGQSVGQISSFIPDILKARLAASLVFYLIDYSTSIDSLSDSGLKNIIEGDIRFKNVHFAYPTRRNVPILRGLTLSVKSGKSLALVGFSGCGKSTVLSLLERFYKPNRGNIFIDGHDIRDLNIKTLRSHMCIVSQEPILFDDTIEANIVYGMEQVDHSNVVEAAKLANIHSFIISLPMGYQTRVGEKGTQLSGGQKQRIAIARALIRNPSILLLDEATSALDTESERLVQKALENAQVGRTCLIIAHRLSTIQNCDIIAVVNEGNVAEKGIHSQLLQQEGIYKSLCDAQSFIQNE